MRHAQCTNFRRQSGFDVRKYGIVPWHPAWRSPTSHAARGRHPGAVKVAAYTYFQPGTNLPAMNVLNFLPMSVLTDSYKASHFIQYPTAEQMVAVSASPLPPSKFASFIGPGL